MTRLHRKNRNDVEIELAKNGQGEKVADNHRLQIWLCGLCTLILGLAKLLLDQ